nr:hypothetical protein [Tanacetum cinerariifolium]
MLVWLLSKAQLTPLHRYNAIDDEKILVDTVAFDIECATIGPAYDSDIVSEKANALVTKELERYKEKEKHFAKEKTIESEYYKKIMLLNDEISSLKSQACQNDKTFAKENKKYDEYVQPLLQRKNKLEKKNQEFLKQNDVENPFVLNKAKELALSMYNIDEMGKELLSIHKIISREELKCEPDKRLKVKQRNLHSRIMALYTHEVNEIRAENIARVANPLALVAQQQPFLLQLQPEWQRFVTLVKQSQELKTVSYHKLYDILKQHQHEVNEIRAENIARVANPLALVAQQQPDNPPRINRSARYENQRIGNVAGASENVDSSVMQKSGIQCYNCKEFRHVARECQKPKRANDADYHGEKMLLCKQEEARIQLNSEQAGWRDDTDDDELEDQELEAHYMYMAQLQEVSPDAADSRPIFDDEPLQKVSNDDHYNVFAMESEHTEQSESVHDIYHIEQHAQNVILDSLDMSHDIEEIDQNDDDNDLTKERELHASLIEKLKCKSDESKNRNKFLETSNKVLIENLKELARRNSKEYASQMELECAKVRGDLLSYKMDYHKSCTKYTETINALNQTISKMKVNLSAHQETISILSKQKEAQIKLYKTQEDKELDKVIELVNKVKVLDNIVYKTSQSVQTMNMLNNKCRTSFAKPKRANPRLYDIGCYNDNLALMLAPDSDEVIRLEKESRSKLSDLIRPFDYDKLNNLRINAGLDQFQRCLNEEMVADLRYFNSLELEVDSLRSQLETQKTQFLNEIDRLSREYYYHMNAILGVYTELDEVTNLQCDYLELLEKCKGLETELSKSKMMSKSFESVQKHAINLELELQQCKEKIKNDMFFKVNKTKDFSKEREQYFEIQDLKAQLQDKGIVIRVILTTSVSRPQLKSNPMGDKVMRNSSQGKKQEVEDQRKSVKFSKNKTSVTACNDSLNAKTLNVKSVSAMCDKCVLNDKHAMRVLNSVAKPIKKTVASESNQKPRNITRKLYERVSKTCSWWYSKFTPSGYKWKPKSGKENVNPNVSMPLGNASRTANIMDTM